MITYTLNVQASSNEFEYAMDRFYTLIYAFSVNSRLDVTVSSTVQKFCPIQRFEKLHMLFLFS